MKNNKINREASIYLLEEIKRHLTEVQAAPEDNRLQDAGDRCATSKLKLARAMTNISEMFNSK